MRPDATTGAETRRVKLTDPANRCCPLDADRVGVDSTHVYVADDSCLHILDAASRARVTTLGE